MVWHLCKGPIMHCFHIHGWMDRALLAAKTVAHMVARFTWTVHDIQNRHLMDNSINNIEKRAAAFAVLTARGRPKSQKANRTCMAGLFDWHRYDEFLSVTVELLFFLWCNMRPSLGAYWMINSCQVFWSLQKFWMRKPELWTVEKHFLYEKLMFFSFVLTKIFLQPWKYPWAEIAQGSLRLGWKNKSSPTSQSHPGFFPMLIVFVDAA